MKRKRIVGVVLALAVVFSCFTVPAFAQENLREEPLTLERRASGRFSITVKAGDVRKADTSFPHEKEIKSYEKDDCIALSGMCHVQYADCNSICCRTEVDDAGGNGYQESGECPQVSQYK